MIPEPAKLAAWVLAIRAHEAARVERIAERRADARRGEDEAMAQRSQHRDPRSPRPKLRRLEPR